MKEMRFDVNCVKECLKNNGKVFTVRKWKSYEVEGFVEVKGIGECKKVRICEVKCKNDIERYVKLSGFANMIDWWNKVEMFGAGNGWLYLVIRKGGNNV